VAEAAERKGIPTLRRFFGPEALEEIGARLGPADLVLGNNVLAHVPGINGFLAAARACLKPGGAAVFEFPSLRELLDKTEFDTIYHEHVFYLSLTAVRALAARAGLEVFDVARQAVHGGSLRVFLQPPGARPPSPAVGALLREEEAAGLTGADRYAGFGRRVAELREALREALHRLKSAGKRIAAYGAPAKGATLLNYCGIGADVIEFTVDRSPHKQGRRMPGVKIPIRPPEALLEAMPDVAVILPWNLADEIVSQQREYLRRGGRFLIPVPHPREVGA
jgi:SAM-dependent methyltransferase